MSPGIRRELRRLQSEVGELQEVHERGRDLEEFRVFERDPVGMAEEIVGVEPMDFQLEGLLSIRDTDRTVIQGGNGTGKDMTTALAALWWVYCRRGLVLLTAATERQAHDVWMRQVGQLFRACPDLPGELYRGSLRVPGVEDCGIWAFTSTSASKLSGFHGAHVLAIVSEAQDVEPFGWEGLMSCAVGSEDRIVATGNPLRPSGRFFKAARSTGWKRIQVSVFDHPNLREGRTVIPGGPSPDFADRMAEEWGESSPIYVARVLGEFPEGDVEGLFRRAWLDEAANHLRAETFRERAREAEPVVAVDPARYGTDKSVAAVCRGPVLERIESWGGRSTMETTGRVLEIAKEAGVEKRHPSFGGKRFPSRGRIVVDTVGLGSGVLDRLKEQRWPASEFKASHSPRGGHAARRFRNVRAQSYWRLREQLEQGEIALPDDDALFEELLAIRWSPTSDGKIALESKGDMRSRLGRSPDRADAVVMAFFGASKGAPPKQRIVQFSPG